MSEDKMKVKDLAGELGVSPKDLIQKLREMDIVAKSASSSVSTDELARVRAQYKTDAEDAAAPKVDRNVIVRRRRRDADEAVPSAQEATEHNAQAGDSSVTAAADSPDASAAPSAAGSSDGATAAATVAPEAVLAQEASQPEAVRDATIVSTPAHAQDSSVDAAAPSATTANITAVLDPTSAPAPSESAVASGEAKPQRKEAKTPKPRPAQPAPTVARVIRRPEDDQPAAPAQVEAAKPAVVQEAAPMAPGQSTVQPPKADNAEAPMADVSAAPLAEASSTTAKDATADSAKGNKPAGEHSTSAKTARLATPDASAMPEGSSAPTLPPRSADSSRNAEGATTFDASDSDEEGHKRRKKRPMDAPTPQVRIISRPSPEAVQRAADNRLAEATRPSRPPYGGGRPGGSGGPGNAGGPGGPGNAGGPGGQGQRPSGPRPGGPGGPGNAGGPGGPRPGGPSYGMGAAPAPGSPEARDAQSKKKRTKGRRTVDFQQGAGDFGRRNNDDDLPRLSRGKGRRKGKDNRPLPSATQPLKAAKRKLRVTEAIRVADMAHQMGLKSNEIIKVLFGLGIMATINQSLDIDTATLVAAEFDYEVEKAGFSEDDYLIPTEADAPELMLQRPPVVTIMGHVDHGKTSLLDAIRKSNVTGGEAGGITQHIGAYHVKTKRGEIVFLDTPGHEAFTAMRARGAQVTDLVVLVVAADDGVMEQTREAINHSKAAGVPIMVAVNKMDKPGADPDRVLRELAELGLQSESWGGDTVTAHVSAKTREGLDDLLELIALQAEILELKANPNKAARGHIVEAKLDKGRGPVATVLIQEGTLHQGDTFVCGVFSGRVRALFNDQGKKIKEAGPAIPVEVQGFEGVPEAGEEFICVTDEKLARRIADTRAIKHRERELAKESKVTLETFLARSPTDQEALTLNLVLKADVQGSLEAITENLRKQSTEKVRINVVHGGAGAISESDILLASASQAIIIGFNVRPTAKIKEVAERESVDIRFYDIIYKLSEEIKSAMAGMLAPVQREVYLGQADVREIYSVPKVGVIAGCHVADGKINRNAGVRLLRDGVVIYTGKVSSLKRFKDDVRDVQKGYECGIGLENYNDIKVGDAIEAFEMIEEAATL